MADERYEMCAHCDHFVAPNVAAEDDPTLALYVHLEDGDQEFDHDAEPSGEIRTLDEWRTGRPDLFVKFRDGRIGPNSRHYPQRARNR